MAKILLKRFTLAALRVYILSPSLSLQPKIEGLPTATVTLVTNRMWAQIASIQHFTNIQRTLNSRNDEDRMMAWYHFLLSSILLQTRKQSIKYAFSFKHEQILYSLMGKCFLSFILDESLLIFWSYWLRIIYTIHGQHVCIDECMICLELKQVENVCQSKHNLCIKCLEQWYKPYGIYQQCPLCRQKMNIVYTKTRNFRWFKMYLMDLIYSRIPVFLASFLLVYVFYWFKVNTKYRKLILNS
jgi:hypothetical protein